MWRLGYHQRGSQNSIVWPTWKEWVEQATEGRVEVVIENYTGDPKAIFDAVEDGVYDVSFAVNSYVPGRFKLTSVSKSQVRSPMQKWVLWRYGIPMKNSLKPMENSKDLNYLPCLFMVQVS